MVRNSNKVRFKKCIELRKKGFSYSEIRREVTVAKSTLQGWLEKAGLLYTKEHLEIQLKKRVENHRAGTEASKLTREKKTQEQVQSFLEKFKNQYLKDPLLIGGCLLYEAEGQKKGECRFSNSDYRMIKYFLMFMQKYFKRSIKDGITFRLYIHKNRKKDLERIINFWSSELSVQQDGIAISWKKHKTKIRVNRDYVGQMSVIIQKSTIINKQIRAYCNIILGS